MNHINKTGSEISYSFNGLYYLRDIKYIIRAIRKISKELEIKKDDIDWLQLLIESFLILNSRVYNDLVPDFISECNAYLKIKVRETKEFFNQISRRTLSKKYEQERKLYRNRAIHGTNYLRVGIIEFQNDVLPKPINYIQTQALENMASVNGFVKMWKKDMEIVSNEIEDKVYQVIEIIRN